MVHHRYHGLDDIIFTLHPCGLHYYDPCGKGFTFVNTVAKNMEPSNKWQLEAAAKIKELYASLAYLSEADFK